MANRKLSGAELAKQLSGLTPSPAVMSEGSPEVPSIPLVAGPSAELPGSTERGQAPFPIEPDMPGVVAERSARPHQIAKGKPASAANPRGGRPAKAGIDGMPVNVRLSQADHLALAKLAGKLMVPGRPMPTVQDVVRGIIRGALKEPELATRFCRQQDN